ncbi:HindVP family restriction endonuclease [Rossellomorea marisflavi]|uniref:HindVP family restriction endonuclease n=1 Tax=Rossellomorea marisflavi TaxID=189381 RepID=UPI003D2F2EB7
MSDAPGLFGINKTNRDFKNVDSWGKNQFNNSFPASLACYMHSINIEPVYLCLGSNLNVEHNKISVDKLFGLEPQNQNLYFAFERDFVPYQRFVEGKLPRVDLVTINNSESLCLRGLEVKLTAIPDHTTRNSKDEDYGCELVIRPDTIVYLALSIASSYENDRHTLKSILDPVCSKITNWTNAREVIPHIEDMVSAIDNILLHKINNQNPLIMQPIWKTEGNSSVLADNCLDMFIWSDHAFTRLFIDKTKVAKTENINRLNRTTVWLTKLLYDFSSSGQINHMTVIDELSYNTKNDKAFALSGLLTREYMQSKELTNPRVTKSEIKSIILGGGEKFLRPERRFDAVIVNTPGLFDSI